MRDIDEVIRLTDELEGLRESLDIPWFEAHYLERLGDIYRMRGEYHAAIDYYNQVVELGQAESNLLREAGLLNVIARTWMYIDQLGEAREVVQRALPIARKTGSVWLLSRVLSTAIEIALKMDDLERASSLIPELERVENDPDTGWNRARSLRFRGLIHLLRGDLISAEEQLHKSIAGVEGRITEEERIRHNLDLAILRLRQGATEDASEQSREVIDSPYPGKDPIFTAQAHLILAKILQQVGKLEEATQQHETAVEILQRLNIEHRLPELEDWIGDSPRSTDDA